MVRLLVLVFVASLGCKSRSEPLEEPPPAEPRAVELGEATEEPSDDEPVVEPATRDPEPAVEPAAAPAPATEPVQPVPTRDLANELRVAVGNLADCLQDYRPATAKTIRVQIGGVVRPTGMIIEPSASGAGLSTNDRRCIEGRVGDVVLEPLAQSSSHAIRTSVDIAYEPPAVETYEVAPPPPPGDDVVQALPKKQPIAPSGVPIQGPKADPIEGPDPVPIEGPQGVPIEGPRPKPIESN